MHPHMSVISLIKGLGTIFMPAENSTAKRGRKQLGALVGRKIWEAMPA